MGRSKRPPPLLYDDDPPPKPKVKEEPGPKGLSDLLNKPFQATPKMKKIVKKIEAALEEAPELDDKEGLEIVGDVSPPPDLKPKIKGGTVVDFKGGKLTVTYRTRVNVIHDEREGTVTIIEVLA